MHEHLEETLVGTRMAFQGNIINVRVDTVKLPSGKEATRDVVEHPGAVAIVPVGDDGKVFLVRQYRHPAGKVLLEIPAGKLDSQEHPDHCAVRELEEETGCRAKELKKLGAVYTTPGFTNEVIHLYVAKGLTQADQNTDEDEFIDIECYTPDELKEMAKDGRLEDAKTLLGLHMAGVLA